MIFQVGALVYLEEVRIKTIKFYFTHAHLSITLLSFDGRENDTNDSKHNETLKFGNMTPMFQGWGRDKNKVYRTTAHQK